jgi:uncharacterized membrane protein
MEAEHGDDAELAQNIADIHYRVPKLEEFSRDAAGFIFGGFIGAVIALYFPVGTVERTVTLVISPMIMFLFSFILWKFLILRNKFFFRRRLKELKRNRTDR